MITARMEIATGNTVIRRPVFLRIPEQQRELLRQNQEPIFLEYFWDKNTSTGSRNSYMTSMLVVVIMATSLHQETGCKTACWVKTFPRRLTALFYVLTVMFSWYFEKTQRFYTLILIHKDIQVWIFVILAYLDTRNESIMAADDWSMSGTMPSTS